MEDNEFDEILKQLKLVTQELVYQIGARFQDVTYKDIETHNLIVRNALDVIQKYEGATFENRWKE